MSSSPQDANETSANVTTANSTCANWAQRESSLLASYAMHSKDSLGREHRESEHPYRGPFQRDRDRILHSATFRRLSGKMQVFTGDMGDYHRTRLTHTHEVASLARTIGRTLRLNEDLIEAMALLHDIGHPPFGHCGEDALDGCLRSDGGFSHNQFALELVTEIEQRYTAYPGLNLTHEVLSGQHYRSDKRDVESQMLEIQVVDAADSIAYDSHDVDDALILVAELVLVQFAEAQAGLQHHIAGAWLEIPTQDLDQGGFAAAIRADQPVAVAIGELDGDAFEQGLGAELNRDIGGREHGGAECSDSER